MRCTSDLALRSAGLSEFIDVQLEEGSLTYFAAYEDVHRQNIERVMEERT